MGEVVHGLWDDVGAEGEAECAEGFVTVGEGQVGFHCDEFRRRRLKVVCVRAYDRKRVISPSSLKNVGTIKK